MSVLWYDSFVKEFYHAVGLASNKNVGLNFVVRDGAAFATCDANYPNLYFMIEGFWLQIPPEDYL